MKIDVQIADQRTQKGTDGRTPEDGSEDCVPESLSAMVNALVPGANTTGDGLHDAVYGDGYVGMQDPAHYVPLLATFGLSMTRFEGTAADEVTRAVQAIEAGHPVLLSIPSDWDHQPPTSGYAHMVAGCDVPDPTHLTAMNPWGVAVDNYAHAGYQTATLAWWQERLARCSYLGIWIVQKATASALVEPKGLPGWKDDGHAILLAPDGKTQVIRGFRDYILAAAEKGAWYPADVPQAAEAAGLGGNVYQNFRYSILTWDKATNAITEHDALDMLHGELDAANKHVEILSASQDALGQQIKALQQEVDNLRLNLGNVLDALDAVLADVGPAKAS